MSQEDDEITRPGTPDSLRTVREHTAALKDVYARLSAICDSLDRIENALPRIGHEARAAKAEAERATAAARQATHVARFTDKRVDQLALRVQGVENAGR